MTIPLDDLDEIEAQYRRQWQADAPCDVTVTIKARLTSIGSKTFILDVPAFYGGFDTIQPDPKCIEEMTKR